MPTFRPDQQDIDAMHEGARFSYLQFNEGAHFSAEELQYIGRDIQNISRNAQAYLHLLFSGNNPHETFFANAHLSQEGMPDCPFRALDHGTHTMILTTIGVDKATHDQIRNLLLESSGNNPTKTLKAA